MSCCKKKSCEEDQIKDSVKEYYGKRLKTSADLQTSACTFSCDANKVPKFIREALKLCHDEVVSKYYGCGLVFPEVLEGTLVLDLGCGSGRDCFVLSQMVGEQGHVTGVDITDEQIEVANKYIVYHQEKFGFSQPNTDFRKGDIENLQKAGVPDSTVDIIVSNGVVNLTSDKKAVINEAYRVLKEGGEVYFSDVYADKHLSDDIRKDEVLWGECIAGALFWRELVDLCKEVGFSGPYLVEGNAIQIEKDEHKKVLGDAKFVSATYRLYKIPRKDENKENFEATYKGSIKEHPEEFKFDVYHKFKNGQASQVSANIADIIRQSRFAKHFDISTKSSGDAGILDPYAIADPFKGLGLSQPSCCGSKPCC